MAYNTSDIQVMGVLFDVSLRHGSNGKTNIDNVKQAMSDFFRNCFEDDDIMYLYHPEVSHTFNRVGAQVAAISNYHTDGWKFQLSFALKQTLFVLAAEPYDDKTLVIITDRMSDTKELKMVNNFNTKDMLGCKVLCIDIGNHLPQCDFARVVSVDDSSQLLGSIKEIIYGNEQCGTADSCAE